MIVEKYNCTLFNCDGPNSVSQNRRWENDKDIETLRMTDE